MVTPFWPHTCPHFLAVRRAVRNLATPSPVIGLSGGADSLALVAAAVAENLSPHAVIIDHQLQEGSADVARGAKKVAESLGATAEVISVTVAPGNLEAMAREARYAALHTVARQRNSPLWVAHTADDQAETFLMSALRGHATGMKAVDGTLVRPLLGVRRAQTLGACEELGLEVWNDPMNQDTAFLRVALRTQIIPQLSDLCAGDAVTSLARAAATVTQDRDVVAAAAGDVGKRAELNATALATLAPAVRRQVIVDFLHHHNLTVSATIVAAVDALVTNWRGQGGVACGGDRGTRLEVVRKNGTISVIGRQTMA